YRPRLVRALAAAREHKRRRGREQECQSSSHNGPYFLEGRAVFYRATSQFRTRAWHRYVSGGVTPQVSLYSGPLPPSGGVRRPPFAVIAPHWTQFDGVTSTPVSVAS